MAIPVALVHLAVAHAALPGLLPIPPKHTMLPLLRAPPCAIVLPISSPPKPSRADAAERWDAHKSKQGSGSSTTPSSSPASSPSSSPGRASSCGSWVSNKNKSAGAATSSSSSSNSSNGRADSVERWDAYKKPPASPASSFSSCSSSRNKRWDAQKSGRRRADEVDDVASSSGSNDMMELGNVKVTRHDGTAGPDPSTIPIPWAALIPVA